MSIEIWNEQLRRGTLEFAILLTLAPAARYGLEIIRHLDAFTDLVIAEGTIYPLLARLTRDGTRYGGWPVVLLCVLLGLGLLVATQKGARAWIRWIRNRIRQKETL